jgi:nucleoside-diphosphate-sugar epimerase
MVAENLDREEIRGQAFNCGTDLPMSVIDMVNLILSLSPHPDLVPKILNQVTNEIKDQYLDSTKIGARIGWEPDYSRKQAMRETIEWYARYLDLAF